MEFYLAILGMPCSELSDGSSDPYAEAIPSPYAGNIDGLSSKSPLPARRIAVTAGKRPIA